MLLKHLKGRRSDSQFNYLCFLSTSAAAASTSIAGAMLIAAGYHIKDIQDFMGHSNIYTTANVYGHLDTSRKNDMVNDISGALL